jgi:hypothetical protein
MEIFLGFGILSIVFVTLYFSNVVLSKLSSKEVKDKVLFTHGKE